MVYLNVYECNGVESAENPYMVYCEFPDGLRLRFEDGKYVGWYVA